MVRGVTSVISSVRHMYCCNSEIAIETNMKQVDLIIIVGS